MQTELPTRAGIFGHTLTTLNQADVWLDDALAWLSSDWQPVGSELTDRQAEARHEIRKAIAAAAVQIEAAKAQARVVIEDE